MVNEVFYTDDIVKVLHEQFQGQGKPLLFLLHGLNTDSNNYAKPAKFEVISSSVLFASPKLVSSYNCIYYVC